MENSKVNLDQNDKVIVHWELDHKTHEEYATFTIRVNRKNTAEKFAIFLDDIKHMQFSMNKDDDVAVPDWQEALSLIWTPADYLDVIDWDGTEKYVDPFSESERSGSN